MIGQLLQSIGCSRFASAGAGPVLRSAVEMDDILRRERMRADRSGGVFSLVRFSLIAAQSRARLLHEVGAALNQQLRATDYAGSLPDGRIGVILPDTKAEGAWKVADNVRRLLPHGVTAPDFEVYEYPLLDLPEDSDTAIDEMLPTVGGTYATEPLELVAASRSAIPLEAMFVRPLPVWKRVLDVVGASFGLLALAPMLLLVTAAIKFTMPGPVLFTQKRTGLGGKAFQIYKFRTMVVDAESRQKELMSRNEQDGPAFKIRNDPRVTPLGQFLRKSSIDELPQLWNVLKGDMTLVGPRPLPCHESDGCQPWQRRRLEVTPGLTCFWQVEGRSQVTFDEWVRMDLKYVSRRSLATDLKLLAQTVPAVLNKKGAC